MRSFQRIFAVLLVTAAVLGRGDLAWAHATPIVYEPESAAIVQTMPGRVRIIFSERIEPKASGITVYAPDGSRADGGDAKPEADPHVFGTTLNDHGEGTYAVSWQVVSSDDGHFTKGAFVFSVGKETAQAAGGQVQVQHITTVPQAVLIGVELVGQAIVLGVLAAFALLWRPLRRRSGEMRTEDAVLRRRLSRLMGSGAALIVIGALSFIILKTFDLQQLRSGGFAETLRVFLTTVDGRYALARAALGALLLALFGTLRKRIFSADRITRQELILLAIVSAMILARARVSHAAASHILPALSVLINAVHLFFKEVWVGGVFVAALAILPPLQRAKDITLYPFFSRAASRMMAVVFGIVGVTGAYIVWLHLKDPAYIFSTQWGSAFILLSLFGTALLAVRLANQFLVKKPRHAAFTYPLEALTGIALLFVTSMMIITTPPYATGKNGFEIGAASQGEQIRLKVHPFEPSRFLATVSDAGTTELIATATNAEKGIGPIVIPAEKRFDGGFVFPQDTLSPAGTWKIDLTFRRPHAYDAVAAFDIDYPQDIVRQRQDPDSRSFGAFEAVILVVAIGIVVFAAFLYGAGTVAVGATPVVAAALLLSLAALPRRADAHGIIQLSGDPTLDAVIDLLGPLLLFALLWGLLELRWRMIRSKGENRWPAAIFAAVLVCSAVWSAQQFVFKSGFQKLCERNGDFWIQSVPMRDGQALSPDTVTGCFLQVGMYHFGDEREYRYFLRQRLYVASLALAHDEVHVGEPVDMTVSLRELRGGESVPASDVGTYHDRILHVQVIGRDLATFAHIHAEDIGPITDDMKKEQVFPLRHAFPKAGRYALNLTYVAGGRERSSVFYVDVQGVERMAPPPGVEPSAAVSGTQTAIFDGYEVTFIAPVTIRARTPVKMRYDIRKDGKPVTDLAPYLGAAMHIGIVREDLGEFSHGHGEALLPGSVWFQQLFGRYFAYHTHFAPERFGPTVITPPRSTVFPTAGVYRVFGEFSHQGKIIVTSFTVGVQ